MGCLTKALDDETSHVVQHVLGESIGFVQSLTLGWQRKQGVQHADPTNDDITSPGNAAGPAAKLDMRSRKSFVAENNSFQSTSRYLTSKLLHAPLAQPAGWVMALLTLLCSH